LLPIYADSAVLDFLSGNKNGVTATIITGHASRIPIQALATFNKQYFLVQVVKSKDFHDRFIIVDNEVYAFGASIKDLGSTCFEVSKNEGTERFLEYIKQVIGQ